MKRLLLLGLLVGCQTNHAPVAAPTVELNAAPIHSTGEKPQVDASPLITVFRFDMIGTISKDLPSVSEYPVAIKLPPGLEQSGWQCILYPPRESSLNGSRKIAIISCEMFLESQVRGNVQLIVACDTDKESSDSNRLVLYPQPGYWESEIFRGECITSHNNTGDQQ